VSKPFSEILLSFLVKRMPEMATTNSQTSTSMLNLFRIVFGSVCSSFQSLGCPPD
jgi:hypothetical protein